MILVQRTDILNQIWWETSSEYLAYAALDISHLSEQFPHLESGDYLSTKAMAVII